MTDVDRAVLKVLPALQPNAYGMTIRQAVSKDIGHEVSIGSIYIAIDFLERRGLVRCEHRGATPERGMRDKRFVFLTGKVA